MALCGGQKDLRLRRVDVACEAMLTYPERIS